MNRYPLPTPNDHHNHDRRVDRRHSFALAGAPALVAALAAAVLLLGGCGSDAESATTPSTESTTSSTAESTVESQPPRTTETSASTHGQVVTPHEAPTECNTYRHRSDIPLQLCDTGDVVELAQEALNAWGAPVEVDGYLGPRTDNAVRDFQVAHGLSVDGIVGPTTWPVLYEYLYAGGDEFDDGSGNTLDEPDGDPVDLD